MIIRLLPCFGRPGGWSNPAPQDLLSGLRFRRLRPGQWWTAAACGRTARAAHVLSRFTPAAVEGEAPRNGELFVMQIDCAQRLYRDQQVNGIPRFRAQWQAAGSDELIVSVIGAVCDAPLAS